MPYLKFDNKQIYHNSEGEGYPLLLLHGNVVSSLMFKQEIEFYKDFFRVIYFDYPGHGRSERLEKFHDDFWYYNAHCAAKVLEHYKVDKCHVIGTSGGALVGLNLAGVIPDGISKMIADSFFGLKLTKQNAEKIIAKRTKAKKDLMTSSFWKYMHGDDWEQIIENDFDMTRRAVEHGRSAIKTDLTKIKFPVLATASREDELIDDIEERTLEVVNLIPEGRAMIFDKGKHPFMITMREKFREIAINFLTSD
jgi:pimeloyl-ACP methyl ester carboxylesterase